MGSEVEALKAAFSTNTNWAEWAAFAVFVGLLGDIAVILIFDLFDKDKSWWEIILAGIASAMIAFGVWGESHFGHRATSASARIQAILEKQTEDAKRDVIKAQTTLERERIERLKLEEGMRPRAIKAEQWKLLAPCLKTASKGAVFIVPKVFDEEAERYAAQIFVVLKEAGFDVRHEPVGKPRPFSFGVSGVFLFVKDVSQPASWIPDMQKCFELASITMPAYGGIPNWAGPRDVMLAVGVKP